MNNKRVGVLVGEHRHHEQCRFCSQATLHPFIDFGYVPLAGGFLRADSTAQDFAQERVYPLEICFCKNCALVQVNNAIAGDVLFKDYFYFSSAIKTLADHFQQYAKDLAQAFPDPSRATIVELGCNDGVLLKPLKAQGFKVVGVDPATNVVKPLIADGYNIINDYFMKESALKVKDQFGLADAILTSNSFAHIDDMDHVMEGVTALLKTDGYLAFEVHYLGILLKEMQYDMMYHEHLSYYSLTSITNFMAKYDMEVFDVKHIPIHAGSVRFSVQRKKTGGRPISDAVKKMAAEEEKNGLGHLETFMSFSAKVEKTRTDLLKLLDGIRAKGETVVGYGASGRATAMSAYCGLTKDYLSAVVDDAPAKQGAYTPGNHIKIQNSSLLKGDSRPDYVLLFAWSFAKEIIAKNQDYLDRGGKFIVPLPEVKVISKDT